LVAVIPSFVAADELRGRLFDKGKKAGNNLEGYVIWLKDGRDLPPLKSRKTVNEMRQIDKQFSPRFLAIMKGETVLFANFDRVFHNVFSLDKQNKFDLGLYKGKKRFSADLMTEIKEADDPVQSYPEVGKFHVFCNIHPDMWGVVYVFDHSYYAVTDRHGLFVLTSPGKGAYTVMIDGPKLSRPEKRRIEIRDGSANLKLDLSLQESAREIPHTKKDGREYQEKLPYGY
jgi:plastocyanin